MTIQHNKFICAILSVIGFMSNGKGRNASRFQRTESQFRYRTLYKNGQMYVYMRMLYKIYSPNECRITFYLFYGTSPPRVTRYKVSFVDKLQGLDL